MNRKFLVSASIILIICGGFYFFLRNSISYDKNNILVRYQEAGQEAASHTKKNRFRSKHHFTKRNTDVGGATIVKFQDFPAKPLFNAPCPVSKNIQAEIVERTLPISFKKSKGHRKWSDIIDVIEKQKSLTAINEKLRDLIIVLIKLEMPNIFHLFGTSEAGDLTEMTRTAICDEVALAHHRIKYGIDPALGQDFNEQQDIELTKRERIFFETMYRACRMCASNAFRHAQAPYTRVAFLPGDDEWKVIKKALDIDEKRPYEVVCTYKPKP